MAFPENLKKARMRKELSQFELANIVGIAQPTLAQYELGIKVPSLAVAIRLAQELDTTCEDLVKERTR